MDLEKSRSGVDHWTFHLETLLKMFSHKKKRFFIDHKPVPKKQIRPIKLSLLYVKNKNKITRRNMPEKTYLGYYSYTQPYLGRH